MHQRITGHTELIGLIATPIRHSKSPMMHNTAFELLGLDYAYLAFDIPPENLEPAVAGLKALGVRGWNVSMPFKTAIMPLLDEVSQASVMCQSVNTVVNDGGVLKGTVTDGIGWMQSLRSAGIDIVGKKITVLGAGGAATAICMQAALDGVGEISIFNRADEFRDRAIRNAALICSETGSRAAFFPLEDLEALRREIADSVLLCNATSAGMGVQADICLIPDADFLRPDLIVTDVIYAPPRTLLLELAERCGCRTLNGLSMMLYQGAAAFRLWTGQDMPVEQVRLALDG